MRFRSPPSLQPVRKSMLQNFRCAPVAPAATHRTALLTVQARHPVRTTLRWPPCSQLRRCRMTSPSPIRARRPAGSHTEQRAAQQGKPASAPGGRWQTCMCPGQAARPHLEGPRLALLPAPTEQHCCGHCLHAAPTHPLDLVRHPARQQCKGVQLVAAKVAKGDSLLHLKQHWRCAHTATHTRWVPWLCASLQSAHTFCVAGHTCTCGGVACPQGLK